jgi:DNA-binding NtrC family response regulator
VIVPEARLILLVEGDRVLRLRGANELLDEGYEVVESESAVEATKILEGRNDFDAMIADVSPGVPGVLALVRYAATHRPDMALMIDTKWATFLPEALEPEGVIFESVHDAGDANNGILVRAMRRLFARQTDELIEASRD